MNLASDVTSGSLAMTSTFPPLAQAISGAIGAAAANVGSYPFDLATTRIQTSTSKRRPKGVKGVARTLQNIVQRDGYLGLFDGLETDTSSTIVSNFFYFYIYSFFRSQLLNYRSAASKSTALPPIAELSVGFLAGVASRALSTPLSLITVRLQSGSDDDDDSSSGGYDLESGEEKELKRVKPTVTSIVKNIYEEDGLIGFWKGYKTAILLCINPSITLFLFQAFRRIFLPAKNRNNPTPGQGFIGGAISNVIAICILYPLMLAKTRVQTSSVNSNSRQRSMRDILQAAYDKNGVQGLYQGIEAQVMKGFINQGLTIMVKQRVEQIMLLLYIKALHRA